MATIDTATYHAPEQRVRARIAAIKDRRLAIAQELIKAPEDQIDAVIARLDPEYVRLGDELETLRDALAMAKLQEELGLPDSMFQRFGATR
jgi:molybdopterin-guanine dinucleotide biosynthesis protein A